MSATRQIVDGDDNLIGQKAKQDMNYAVDIYRATGLWLTNSSGEVLLAQRNADRNDAGRWGPAAGGTVEGDETYEANIYKEAKEEIGLEGVALRPHHKSLITGSRNYFCQYFVGEVDKPAEDFELQAEEVSAVRWVDTADLLKDVDSHPDRYVPGFGQQVKLLMGVTA